MLTWNCEQVRADLSAYHDEELPIADRIAIADHLETCPACAVEAGDLIAMREALQASSHSEEIAWLPALARLQSDILQRWEAEEQASLTRRIRNLFDDPRRASASLGAAVVASFCCAVGALVLAQGQRHPASLQAQLAHVSQRGDIALPEGPVELPRAYADAVMPAAVLHGDADEVAFAGLVTEAGDLIDLQFLGELPRGPKRTAARDEALSQLLNAAATARFQPARLGGAPVSLNVVWVVSRQTVRPPVVARVHVRVDGWRML